MKKKSGEKASITSEELFKICEKYSKNDDVNGLLAELEKDYGFQKPKPRNILQRLMIFMVKNGKTLSFPALASSGEKVIRWSIKGLTVSKALVPVHLYEKAFQGKISYDVSMDEKDLSIKLTPKK